MEQKTFIIPDSGKIKTPFKDLHFYKWLSENEKEGNHHSINSKRTYLESLGFEFGKDKLSKEDLTILKYTLEYHWDFNFKQDFINKLEAENQDKRGS